MRKLVAVFSCLLSCLSAEAADLDMRRAAVVAELGTLPPLVASPQTCQRIGFHGHAAEPAWVVIDFQRQVTPERVALFPARLPSGGSEQSGFPSAFTVEISDDPEFAAHVLIAEWREPETGAGERLPFWMAPGNGAKGRYLRIKVNGFRASAGGEQFFRLGEIVVLANGQNAALRCPTHTSASLDSPRRWEPANLTDGYFWCLPLIGGRGSTTNGARSPIESAEVVDGATWLEVDLGQAERIDEIHLVPAWPIGQADLPGYGFPTHFQLLADPETATAKLLLNETVPAAPAEALPNPGPAQVMLTPQGLTARRVRLAAQTLWRLGPLIGSSSGPEQHVLALAELQCWRGGRNLAAGKPVATSHVAEGEEWSAAALTDGFSSRHELLDWKVWLEGIARRAELEGSPESARTGSGRCWPWQSGRWSSFCSAASARPCGCGRRRPGSLPLCSGNSPATCTTRLERVSANWPSRAISPDGNTRGKEIPARVWPRSQPPPATPLITCAT